MAPELGPGAPAVLAEVRRGGLLEGTIRGHLVLVDGAGSVQRALGDPELVSTLRSSSKPFQAASFVESGALAALGLDQESLAIACASHHGEPGHVRQARRILDAAGLPEAALRCGIHPPNDPTAARELFQAGGTPSAIHNNCSGKHAAMLATCAHRNWPVATYLDRGHPLQEEIAQRLARHAGVDAQTMPYGTDGCGLPTFGLPLRRFAMALAVAAGQDPAVQECQAAMAAHPWLVGGTTSFDTALMRAAGDRLTAKGGAAAIFGASARDGSWALVIKLESGAPNGLSQIASSALEQLGLVEVAPADVAPREVSNWVGTKVGEITPCFQI